VAGIIAWLCVCTLQKQLQQQQRQQHANGVSGVVKKLMYMRI